jgi:outer membrane protein TolC
LYFIDNRKREVPMRKYILVAIAAFVAAPQAFALTMEDAVKTALEKNYTILASQESVEAMRYSEMAAKTPYMPQVDADYTYATSTEKAYGTEDEIATFELSAVYNLFNGFSDRFTVKAAKSAYLAEKDNANATRQDIALSVKKAYINVLSAIDSVTVAENAYTLLENQLKDITLSYNVGYVAKNEVLKVEAELASSKQGVLSAKSAVRTAVFNLENLMNEAISSDEVFAPIPEYTGGMEGYETLKDEMLKARSELKYLKKLIDAKDYTIKSTKGGYLPKVNVGASYYSYGEDMNPSDREYTYDNETVMYLNVNMNLFDGFYKYNTSRSLTSEKMSMMNTLRETRSNMELQLKNALENLDLAKASLEAADKELTSAQENYRITQNQFKQKVATNTDLMDARVMLTRAENTYNTAKFNIHRAVADIERIVEKEL